MHLCFLDENEMCLRSFTFFLSVSPQPLDPIRRTMIWKSSVPSGSVQKAHDWELILDPVRKEGSANHLKHCLKACYALGGLVGMLLAFRSQYSRRNQVVVQKGNRTNLFFSSYKFNFCISFTERIVTQFCNHTDKALGQESGIVIALPQAVTDLSATSISLKKIRLIIHHSTQAEYSGRLESGGVFSFRVCNAVN